MLRVAELCGSQTVLLAYKLHQQRFLCESIAYRGDPGYFIHPDPSEIESEPELDEPGIVLLRADNAKCGVRTGSKDLSRGSELRPVKRIEEFRAKLQVESLCDRSILHDCDIPVVDSRRADGTVGPAFVTECEFRRRRET